MCCQVLQTQVFKISKFFFLLRVIDIIPMHILVVVKCMNDFMCVCVCLIKHLSTSVQSVFFWILSMF